MAAGTTRHALLLLLSPMQQVFCLALNRPDPVHAHLQLDEFWNGYVACSYSYMAVVLMATAVMK